MNRFPGMKRVVLWALALLLLTAGLPAARKKGRPAAKKGKPAATASAHRSRKARSAVKAERAGRKGRKGRGRKAEPVPATLEGKVRRVLGTRANSRYFWGISVTDLNTGREVFSHQPDRLFSPASTMKLLTTFSALKAFGKDHRFDTEVLSTATPDSQGVLRGPLVLRGGGDLSWTYRFFEGDYDKPVQAFVDQLLQRTGIKKVEGDLVADDTYFFHEPYVPSWNSGNLRTPFGARVSALALDDNIIRFEYKPGRGETPPAIMTYPDLPEGAVLAQTSDNGGTDIGSTISESDEPAIYTSIPRRRWPYAARIPAPDPATFFAHAVKLELRRRGVEVTGAVSVRHRTGQEASSSPETQLLARIEGRTLGELLDPVLQHSVNMYAEILLRHLGVGQARPGTPERVAGIQRIYGMWKEVLESGENIRMMDGSGLSPSNMITPAAMTAFLACIHKSPEGEFFRSLLPLSGETGTLAHRLRTASGRVWAKTGQLEQVNSLAGFLQARNGHMYAFSIFANNHPGRRILVKSAIDSLVQIFASHDGE